MTIYIIMIKKTRDKKDMNLNERYKKKKGKRKISRISVSSRQPDPLPLLAQLIGQSTDLGL